MTKKEALQEALRREALFQEALAEDRREGGVFDGWSFAAFFPEDKEIDVSAAWLRYKQHHWPIS